MAKHCPLYNCKVLYLDCLECENKICKKEINKNVKRNKETINTTHGRKRF